MHLEVEGDTIEKKAYLGRSDLIEVEIPAQVRRIEDWAFAQCERLRRVALPHGIEYIGKNVFLGCDTLERVLVFGGEQQGKNGIPEVSYLARMTAVLLRDFGCDNPVDFTDIGSSEWISSWDMACTRYICVADDSGFMPFLAGGEEDYEDAEYEKIRYCYKMQKRKALILLHRLSLKDTFPVDEALHAIWTDFLNKITIKSWTDMFENQKEKEMGSGYGPLTEVLLEDEEHLYENFQVCIAEDLFTVQDMHTLIAGLPEEYVEFRATLLHYANIFDAEKNVWGKYSF